MIKQMLHLGMVVGALAFASSGVRALDFDTNQDAFGALGSWHVTLVELAHTATLSAWSIDVKANTGPTGATTGTPNAVAHHVSLTLDDGISFQTGTPSLGATTGIPLSSLDGFWAPSLANSTPIRWDATLTAGISSNQSVNHFDALFALNSGLTSGHAGITITDGLNSGLGSPPSWSFYEPFAQPSGGPLVPEASSLALLLPGLIPIGIAIRRRRAARG